MYACHHGLGHRHSIFCLVPPQILRHIALHGTDAERRAALDTLSYDATHRSHRAAMNLIQSLAPGQLPGRLPPLAAGGTPTAHRQIFDWHGGDPVLARAEGQKETTDPAVNQAYDGFGHTFDFYLDAYKRNSIDNRGLWIIAYVHYQTGYDNAFWDGRSMSFGDGTIFTGFTAALDVIGHELTHGVTQYEASLAYHDQAGALNESISDVFGSLVKQYALHQTADKADWLIGKGIIRKYPDQALRSMKAPGTAYDNPLLGKDPQPADFSHYDHSTADNGGVHLNSGIPNRAFYLLATKLGGSAWVKAGQIWYDTLRDPALKAKAQTATFQDFAALTVGHAKSLYGPTSAEADATNEAWKTVGVL
jgi:Zn-dependent metalloprotease